MSKYFEKSEHECLREDVNGLSHESRSVLELAARKLRHRVRGLSPREAISYVGFAWGEMQGTRSFQPAMLAAHPAAYLAEAAFHRWFAERKGKAFDALLTFVEEQVEISVHDEDIEKLLETDEVSEARRELEAAFSRNRSGIERCNLAAAAFCKHRGLDDSVMRNLSGLAYALFQKKSPPRRRYSQEIRDVALLIVAFMKSRQR